MTVGFTVIGQVDVWALSSSLRSRLSLFPSDSRDLPLRMAADPDRDDGMWKVHKEWRKWTALTTTVKAVAALPQVAGSELGTVTVLQFRPGETMAWRPPLAAVDELTPAWSRFHLPIVTNVGMALFSGPFVGHFEAGSIVWINQALPQSALNLGRTSAYHLLLSLRVAKPKVETENG